MTIVDMKQELCQWHIHCITSDYDETSTDSRGLIKATIVNWGRLDYKFLALVENVVVNPAVTSVVSWPVTSSTEWRAALNGMYKEVSNGR